MGRRVRTLQLLDPLRATVRALLGALLLSCLAWPASAALAQSTGTPSAQGAPGASGGSSAGTGSAAGLIQTDSNARVDFGNQIGFALHAVSLEPITNVLFLYQVDDSTVQNTAVPSYQAGTTVTAGYAWRVAGVLVPGSEVRYQWQIETQSGKRLTTAEQSVIYNDTRFSWKEARADKVVVYYRDGDAETGQALLDEALKEQTRLAKDFGITVDRPLRIFAYTRANDLISAIGGRPADAAVAIGSDRIFVLAPTGTSAMGDALKSVRREIAGAVFQQLTKNPYAQAPRWLADGFASYIAGDQVSQENYKALGQIASANQLLPLKTLAGNYPASNRDRALAIAESVSAVQFMMETYGADKVRAVMAAFKEGSTVDDAVKKGLGVSFDQFETRWKSALKNGSAAKAAAKNSTPAGPADRSGHASAGNGGVVDRLFGPAIGFWQGIFGAYTRAVLMGFGGVVAVCLVAVLGTTIYGAVKRANAED